MKSYYQSDRLQLVGKAWEIRHQTRKWLKEGAAAMTLADFLQSAACSPQPPGPHNKPIEKSKGLRVLVYPSS